MHDASSSLLPSVYSPSTLMSSHTPPSSMSGGADWPTKSRKPYVIQKNRETWTDEEHELFEQALKKEGRNWKRMAELIPSKTVIQIRSHAQKYFLKLDKAGQHDEIPPARAKKRAQHPYPKSRSGPNKTSSYSWNKSHEERLMADPRLAASASSAAATAVVIPIHHSVNMAGTPAAGQKSFQSKSFHMPMPPVSFNPDESIDEGKSDSPSRMKSDEDDEEEDEEEDEEANDLSHNSSYLEDHAVPKEEHESGQPAHSLSLLCSVSSALAPASPATDKSKKRESRRKSNNATTASRYSKHHLAPPQSSPVIIPPTPISGGFTCAFLTTPAAISASPSLFKPFSPYLSPGLTRPMSATVQTSTFLHTPGFNLPSAGKADEGVSISAVTNADKEELAKAQVPGRLNFDDPALDNEPQEASLEQLEGWSRLQSGTPMDEDTNSPAVGSKLSNSSAGSSKSASMERKRRSGDSLSSFPSSFDESGSSTAIPPKSDSVGPDSNERAKKRARHSREATPLGEFAPTHTQSPYAWLDDSHKNEQPTGMFDSRTTPLHNHEDSEMRHTEAAANGAEWNPTAHQASESYAHAPSPSLGVSASSPTATVAAATAAVNAVISNPVMAMIARRHSKGATHQRASTAVSELSLDASLMRPLSSFSPQPTTFDDAIPTSAHAFSPLPFTTANTNDETKTRPTAAVVPATTLVAPAAAAMSTPLKPAVASFYSPLTPGPIGLNGILSSPFTQTPSNINGLHAHNPHVFSPVFATPSYDAHTPDKQRTNTQQRLGSFSPVPVPFFHNSPSA